MNEINETEGRAADHEPRPLREMVSCFWADKLIDIREAREYYACNTICQECRGCQK